jgi:hypothetical protein
MKTGFIKAQKFLSNVVTRYSAPHDFVCPMTLIILKFNIWLNFNIQLYS